MSSLLVVRAPLRISLFGGGTDLPSFYEKHGSTIVSFAIDKYIYLAMARRWTGGYRISYGLVEEIASPEQFKDIQHTLVRAAMLRYGCYPCTLSIIGDMPKETGLGSSSALSVALVRAFTMPLNKPGWIAEEAFDLECSTGVTVGKQDHYAASYGGFRTYKFNGGMQADSLPLSTLDNLIPWSLLLYTGRTRQAQSILSEQNEHGNESALLDIKSIADHAAAYLAYPTIEPSDIAHWLHQSWLLKRLVVQGITDDVLDAQYECALDNGALGGKLLGAGGGGCWFFIAPPDSHHRIKTALGLQSIPWHYDVEGCKVMLDGFHGIRDEGC